MSKRILILDDDADFNSLLTDVFSQAAYDVTSVREPNEALSRFKEGEFDLVVTDHRMPQMTGSEFIDRVREVRDDVPVVMVSGYLDKPTIRDLITKGVGGIFLKPLNIYSLLKKTQDLMERAEAEPVVDGLEQAGGETENRKIQSDFRSYPGIAKASLEFANELHRLRDFRSKLLLIGEKGIAFDTIAEDLRRMGDADTEDFLSLSNDELDESGLLKRLDAARFGGARLVTLIIAEAEKLSDDNVRLLQRINRKRPPFDDLGFDVRLLFYIEDELDSFYEKGGIDETLYLFLGTKELKAPPLRLCREDIPVLAQKILLTEAEREDATVMPLLDDEACSLLQSRNWPGNHAQIKAVLLEAARRSKGSLLTAADLESVLEPGSGGPVETSPPPVDLESELRKLRDDYIGAVATLMPEAAAQGELLGISRELFENRKRSAAKPKTVRRREDASANLEKGNEIAD